jgi:predicted small lipoprotein YifL
VSFLSDRRFARLAAIGALAAALGLAACGRKGPLDPPPSAIAPQLTGGQAAPVQPPAFDASGKPIAPPGERKAFILDGLLN